MIRDIKSLYCCGTVVFWRKIYIWGYKILVILGRVVRKPVNVNPRLNVNWSIMLSCLKMFFASNVWCSLRLLQLKTEGQTICTEHHTKKLQNWVKSKLSLTVGWLNRALDNPAQASVYSLKQSFLESSSVIYYLLKLILF